jgi:hypothetical protein
MVPMIARSCLPNDGPKSAGFLEIGAGDDVVAFENGAGLVPNGTSLYSVTSCRYGVLRGSSYTPAFRSTQ